MTGICYDKKPCLEKVADGLDGGDFQIVDQVC